MLQVERGAIVAQRSERSLYLRVLGETAVLPKIAEIDQFTERWRVLPALQRFIAKGTFNFSPSDVQDELNRVAAP
eukprot:15450584-Alexandrium_andersonii.AAC.1